MRIDQVLVGAREGDAITQIALNLRTVLSQFGGSDVFARYVDPTVAGSVRPVTSLPDVSGPADIVILHVSIGDDVVWNMVAALPGRTWIVYHNITPAEFFPEDPTFASHLRQGRTQLAALAPQIERVLTVSEFNRGDLLSMGFDEVVVMPGMLDPGRLMRLPSDPHFGRQVAVHCPGPVILFVGQVMPHKRPDLLVAAHHLLLSQYDPTATLILAGHHPSQRFAGQLACYADSLGLGERAWITGGVPDTRLAELYRHADVVVTASKHEGLCLPVVEAMAMSVPVVVSDHGALPETAAGCGIVVHSDSAEGYAEAFVFALDPRHRAAMALRGRDRARSMSLESSASAVSSLVREWLGAGG